MVRAAGLRVSRLAITLFFVADGMVVGTFAGRLPALQQHAGVTSAQLGLALLASSVGAMIAMPLAGRLCERIGSRIVLVAVLFLACGALFLTSQAASLLALAGAVCLFGAGFGSINVAANAQAIVLEGRYERRILSSFHAAFSAGGLSGAGLAAVVAGLDVSAQSQFAVVALVLSVAGAVAGFGLVDEPGRTGASEGRLLRPPRAILVLDD